MKMTIIDFGNGTVELTEGNEATIKHFLWTNFSPDKELIIKDENNNIIDTLKLEDLFTQPLKK